MIKIGIIPTYNENKSRPFKNTLTFVSNYPKRLLEVGAVPLGIVFPDGIFCEKQLKPFDGFIIPGGANIRPYHLLTIHYCLVNNKPLLGICLGHQAIGAYDYVVSIIKKQNKTVNYKTIEEYFKKIEDEKMYLKKVEGHDLQPNFYNNSIIKASHVVYINSNTKLFNIYQSSKIIEPSIHNWVLKQLSSDFTVSAISEEGYIEALEYCDATRFIIGLQFHPELEAKNNILFQKFINECKQREIN